MTATAAGVDGLLAWATDVLRDSGVASPDADAELLLAHALGGTSRSAVRTRRLTERADGPPLPDDQRRLFVRLVTRRAEREPLQHITGTVGFRRIGLHVGPGVFVPRPETEVLVDWVLDMLADDKTAEAIVVDAGTGSGAIALAIAGEAPRCRVWAVERDPVALRWARRNIERHDRDGTVVAVPGDIADLGIGLLDDLAGRVSLVVSNPPYVPDGSDVTAEVLRDPAGAVWGGADGLDVVRPLVAAAGRMLSSAGWLAVEHDEGSGRAIRDLLGDDGRWTAVRTHPDLTGRDRFTVARYAGPGGVPSLGGAP